MIIGVYQFASTGDITSNLKKITYAINSAAEKGIDLIAFHECALCGYPPIESEIEKVNKQDVDSALKTISDIAGRLSINVAVGTIRFESNKKYNSVILFGRDGSVRGIYDKKALPVKQILSHLPVNKKIPERLPRYVKLILHG